MTQKRLIALRPASAQAPAAPEKTPPVRAQTLPARVLPTRILPVRILPARAQARPARLLTVLTSAMLALIVLALPVLLTACAPASGSAADDGKVTLTIMGKKNDMEKEYMQRIFRLYEESGKGHLRILYLDDEDADYEMRCRRPFPRKTRRISCSTSIPPS